MKKTTLLFFITYFSFISFGQVSKTVNVGSAGTLSALITVSEANTVTNLTVTGNIDARDVAFMRDKMTVLSVLDLTSTVIKTYTGTDATNAGQNTVYGANEIPTFAFYDPYLFTYKSTLTSIKFPSTLTKIGTQAFYYSWNLAGTITIPSTVTSIADYAFYGCSSISSFSVPTTNTRYSTVNGVLFNKNQDSLFVFPAAKTGSYSIPTTVKHVGASSFENCYYVTSITFPTSVISIGSYAFSYCSGITGNLTLPTSLKSLGDGAFYGCWNLTGTVTIPATLTQMGNYCFLESNNITAYNVNSSNPNFTSNNGMVYSKNIDTLFVCPSAKTGIITIPSSVKLIGSHAFYNCTKITSALNIPASVDYIGYYAFYGCSLLTEFTVDAQNQYFTSENGVLLSKNKDRLISCPTTKSGIYQLPITIIDIDPCAFAFCQNISGELYIPASVSTIGDYAFYNCKLITSLKVDNANTRFSSDNGVLFNRNRDTLLVCPLGKTGSYTVPTTVKYIGYSAFDSCTGITSVTLPTSLTGIGNYAFEYCTGLSKIHIPKNTTSIAGGAFYSCTNLTEFSIANPQPPVVDYYTFDLVNKSSCKLIVPTSNSTLYKTSNYWKEFTQITEQTFLEALNTNNVDQLHFLRNGNQLIVDGLNYGDTFWIYNVQGVLISNGKCVAQNCVVNIANKGIYIFKTGNKAFKILI